MKWSYAGDQAQLMGRRSLAHGIHAWAVNVSNMAEPLNRPPQKDVGKVKSG
jgi:hypothetical protein